MTIKRIQFIITLNIILLLFVSDPGYTEKARGVTDTTIKVGGIMDMSGPAAELGTQMHPAHRNYFRWINEKGGINGRKIKYICEDDGYSIPRAIAAFKKLVFKDEVICILATGGSGQTIALTSQIEKEKIICLTIGMSERVIFNSSKPRYIFMYGISYGDTMKVIIDYLMADLKAKKSRIAYIYPANEVGFSGLRVINERFKLYGVNLVGKEIVAPGAVDLGTQILGLKRVKPEYVLIQHFPQTAVAIFRAAKRFGLSTRFCGTFYITDDHVVKGAGKSAKGYLGTQSFDSWYADTPGMRMLRETTLRYNPATENRQRIKQHIQGWAGAKIFTEAMKRAGRDLNSKTMLEGMESLRNYNTGVSAPITYTTSDHKGGGYCKVYKANVNKSILVPITEWRKALSTEGIERVKGE